MNPYRALIIDDHRVTCRGYKYFFENAMDNGSIPTFDMVFAHDSESVFHLLTGTNSQNTYFDLIFLDIKLPVFPKGKIYSGEDLGLLIRLHRPLTKLIVQTSISDNHLLYNIFRNLNPEGILVKSDLVEENFVTCVRDVLDDVPFYTRTFSKLLRNQFSKTYVLDQEDRQLLYLLNTGVPSKEISNRLLWSSSKVEKRKRLLRKKFGVDDKNGQSLITAARKAGFL